MTKKFDHGIPSPSIIVYIAEPDVISIFPASVTEAMAKTEKRQGEVTRWTQSSSNMFHQFSWKVGTTLEPGTNGHYGSNPTTSMRHKLLESQQLSSDLPLPALVTETLSFHVCRELQGRIAG